MASNGAAVVSCVLAQGAYFAMMSSRWLPYQTNTRNRFSNAKTMNAETPV